MRLADFDGTPTGRLVPTVFDGRAFVPHPLPPPVDWGAIARPLGGALSAMGELRGACRRLANPYILIRPLQRLEAQTSSAMEGTHTTSDDLALAEAGIERNLGLDAVEVANYVAALAWAEAELEGLPISGRLIRGAHARLLERVGQARGQAKRPGEFRRDQNMIGGRRLETARFVPPPPREAEEAMADLERHINRDRAGPAEALVDIALVHYKFETIHPFADGNGRVGRMLVSLMAVTTGLLDLPVLYLSPELETRKDAYIDLMYRVSSRGVWTDWLTFFLDVATLSAGRAVRTIDRVLALHEAYRARALATSRSTNLLALIDLIFHRPVLEARVVAQRLGVTDRAARTLLAQLASLGILDPVPDLYPAAWAARELIDLSRPDAI